MPTSPPLRCAGLQLCICRAAVLVIFLIDVAMCTSLWLADCAATFSAANGGVHGILEVGKAALLDLDAGPQDFMFVRPRFESISCLRGGGAHSNARHVFKQLCRFSGELV